MIIFIYNDKEERNQVYDTMIMSQFNKDNDVFSDCGIRRRCAPNHFIRAQNRYRSGIICNLDGHTSIVFSIRYTYRHTYGKTLITCSDTKMSFGHLRERGR